MTCLHDNNKLEVGTSGLFLYIFFLCVYVQLMVSCWFGVGGLDSWNPLMKEIVTWVYP